jgi:hypothetical protein
MNFDEMILAHSRWKTRFRKFIETPTEDLDAETIGADDRCDLGKWIHGEGSRHAGCSEYEKLKSMHAKFHAAGANVVQEVRSGSAAKAREMLDSLTGEFGRASSECISAIAALRDALRRR